MMSCLGCVDCCSVDYVYSVLLWWAYTMTATNHDHDGHKPRPWRPQQWKREKLTPNVQLSSFNIVRSISPSWPSWFVAVIVEPRCDEIINKILCTVWRMGNVCSLQLTRRRREIIRIQRRSLQTAPCSRTAGRKLTSVSFLLLLTCHSTR